MPALEVAGVRKDFPGTRALDGIDLAVNTGEVHALLGGNGSGKSTLVKALAGVQPADSGTFRIRGRVFAATSFSPSVAREQRLHFVHQEPTTFPLLTVAENLAIGSGFATSAAGRIRWSITNRHAEQVLRRFRINAQPTQELALLGPATRTMVVIARALQNGGADGSTGILVLDEPTASLPGPEIDELLSALRGYADAGYTIVYVTHRLDEVLRLADRATVLRDGRVTATLDREQISRHRLVELIAGGSSQNPRTTRTSSLRGPPLLVVDSLAGGPIQSASFQLHAGEIVGIAGLLGSGRTSLLSMLFGLREPHGGKITLESQPYRAANPSQAMGRGLALLPEDRSQSAFLDLSVSANLTVASLVEYWARGHLRRRQERTDSERLMQAFGIKATLPTASLASVSGGNQQKVMLARWLRRKPRVLLLDEPTQGVDVASRAGIHDILREVAANGTAILAVLSDFEELTDLCTRALVLSQGRIVANLVGEECTVEKLNAFAYGTGT